MRLTAAVKRSTPFRSNVETTSIPAPTGGWDAISALANMPEDRAVQLDNWVPRTGWIEPRKGYTSWGTGLGTSSTPVETVMAYYGTTSVSDKLFAIAGGTFYDVTSQGAAVATTVTGMANSKWQYCNFTNSSGTTYLIACNGVDTPKIYNGSVWADTTITGVTQTELIQPYVYQGRLWFVRSGASTLSPVYLGVGAIAGAATAFPLGSFITKGGYMMAIASWSVDTRQTVNDYLAFVTSRGQVIVYYGTDPASATDWTLVGLYNLGRPLGRRCTRKIAGDLAIITVDGITSMNTMLLADRATGARQSITENIFGAIQTATSLYGDNFGWQFIDYPVSSLALLNIPVTENTEQMQFVMNTITGAWCRFLGLNGNVWELFGDQLFFGGNDGTVYLWDYGSVDDGDPITCTAKSAFNYFRTRGYTKRFTLLQPVITSDGNVIPGTGINVDFGADGTISTPNISTGNGSLWNFGVWDTAVWGGSGFTQANWITVSGIGHCASVITQVATGDTGSSDGLLLQLNSWNVMYERGGPL